MKSLDVKSLGIGCLAGILLGVAGYTWAAPKWDLKVGAHNNGVMAYRINLKTGQVDYSGNGNPWSRLTPEELATSR